LKLCYLETLKKDQAQNILLSNRVHTFIKNSRRFTEGTHPLFFLLICYCSIFLYHKRLYTYYPSCYLSDLHVCMYDTGKNFI
jgi:hypothetical protein